MLGARKRTYPHGMGVGEENLDPNLIPPRHTTLEHADFDPSLEEAFFATQTTDYHHHPQHHLPFDHLTCQTNAPPQPTRTITTPPPSYRPNVRYDLLLRDASKANRSTNISSKLTSTPVPKHKQSRTLSHPIPSPQRKTSKLAHHHPSTPNLALPGPSGHRNPPATASSIIRTLHDLCGLPQEIGKIYEEKGIHKLYQWQEECLPFLKQGISLVYSLPTSGGKTLPAELQLLRCSLLQQKKALFVLPFISIVAEKAESLSRFSNQLTDSVEAYYSHMGKMPVPPGKQIMVATIEKAFAIVNHMIEEKRLDELGCVVVDELHMVGDGDRGVLLEIMLSKLVYLRPGAIQIIGMSATAPNIEEIAYWLRAGEYTSPFRPVPLHEYVKIGPSIMDNSMKEVRRLVPVHPNDRDHLLALCSEVCPTHSVIIFCSSKDQTTKCADDLYRMMASIFGQNGQNPTHQNPFQADMLEYKKADKAILLSNLKSVGSKDSIWDRIIPYGVAFHNAGLTSEERELIEQGFSDRVLTVLTSTTTLSAGVNLPARRVIIRGIKTGIENITARVYKQMCGRAGRAGMDDYGESFLMPMNPKQDTAHVKRLVSSPMEPVLSSLKGACSHAIKRIVLDSVCGGIANTFTGIATFLSCTLIAQQIDAEVWTAKITAALDYLISQGFLVVLVHAEGSHHALPSPEEQLETFDATPLGHACYKSTLSPEEAIVLHAELNKANQGMVLSDDLHLCYLTVPLFDLPLDATTWQCLYRIYEGLPDIHRKIADMVGVSPGQMFNNSEMCDRVTLRRNEVKNDVLVTRYDSNHVCARFFGALALSELIQETPIEAVSAKYGLPRGSLENLRKSAATYARMVMNFCNKMGWVFLEALLQKYCPRFDHGVKEEIVPFMDIPRVGNIRARHLWNAGYRSIKEIALAKAPDMARKVRGLGPPNVAERLAGWIIRGAGELLEKQNLEMRKQLQATLELEAELHARIAPS
eukprot:TRINITY_DN6311_c0_g1_i7.p1 TRINITY_DN6311_c0_g1~~TRINITY_DN6311_c0_g1_i7.p1  ORF type:complete len:980 (+),score=109.11 TRINITY_DN6311_c0_g1_i7:49-2988(+)